MLRRNLLSACIALALVGVASAQETTPPAPPPPPRVTLETTMGAITIELDTVGAPRTSAHMLRLFRSRHYVGAAVFRIEPGFLIQLGDLDRNLVYRRPPVGAVPLETATNKHARGTLGLAHGDDPNSGQSSFYFDLAENSGLNATPDAPPNTTGFTAFAKVVAGMDVVDRIAAVERDPTKGPFPGMLPKTPIVITAVRVE